MRHTRQEVIQRAIHEYELLDHLVAGLTPEQWAQPVPRPEMKDPWTVKDALAHITHWKTKVTRIALGQPPPAEKRGLNDNDINHLIYLSWRERSPQEILARHRQVQAELLAALRAAPEDWYSARERNPQWPFNIDGHSAEHRLKDIARALTL
jgi:hypothetical protein